MTTIHKALVAALKDIKNPSFDRENTHFRNKYATLASHVEAARTALAKHGLAVIQPLSDSTDGRFTVKTILVHESGETMESSISFGPIADPQKLGSAVTYLRRYSLASMLGIVGEDDDDAEAAVGRGGNAPPPASARRESAAAAKPKTREETTGDTPRLGRWTGEDRVDPAAPTKDLAGRIESVDEKTGTTKSGKPWKKWLVKMADGQEAGTFHESCAAMCRRYMEAGASARLGCVTNAKGYLDIFEVDVDVPF